MYNKKYSPLSIFICLLFSACNLFEGEPGKPSIANKIEFRTKQLVTSDLDKLQGTTSWHLDAITAKKYNGVFATESYDRKNSPLKITFLNDTEAILTSTMTSVPNARVKYYIRQENGKKYLLFVESNSSMTKFELSYLSTGFMKLEDNNLSIYTFKSY